MDVKSSAENLIVKEGIGGREMNFISFLLFFFFFKNPFIWGGFFFPTFDLVFIYFLFFSKRQKKHFLEKKKNFLDLVHKQQPPFV